MTSEIPILEAVDFKEIQMRAVHGDLLLGLLPLVTSAPIVSAP